MTAPRLLRTADAARALGITRTTLYRWEQAGAVTPTTRTLGGQARWDLEDLRRQLAAARERGTQLTTEPEPEQQPAPRSPRSAGGHLGTGEAAARVGVSTSALKKWAAEGLVTPADRVGTRRDMRWDLEQLRQQMAEHGLAGRQDDHG